MVKKPPVFPVFYKKFKKIADFVYKGKFFIIIAPVDADRWQSG